MQSSSNGKEQLPVDERIISTLSHAQQEMMAGLNDMGQVCLQGITQYNQEVVRFLSGRIREDINLNSEFSKCRSLTDVAEIQNTFVHKAVQEYAEETERLTRISAQIISDDFVAVNRHISAIAEEVEQVKEEMANERTS